MSVDQTTVLQFCAVIAWFPVWPEELSRASHAVLLPAGLQSVTVSSWTLAAPSGTARNLNRQIVTGATGIFARKRKVNLD